ATVQYLRRHPDDHSQLITVAVLASLWIAEFVTMLAVINQTWRKTILSVGPEHVILTFSSVFGRRQHHWSSREVGAIAVVPRQEDPDAIALGEIHMQVVDR